ncbi:MAG: phosphate starvation-inducible PhoH-like protein [Lentisphaeria bacterium]
MDTHTHELSLTLEPDDSRRLAAVCGQFDSHIKLIEQRLKVEIRHRGNQFFCAGSEANAANASNILKQLFSETLEKSELTPDDVHLSLHEVANAESQDIDTAQETRTSQEADKAIAAASVIKTKKISVKPRGANQQRYVAAVRSHDINFGVGPAGTGKTYLAVACAVESLLQDEVERILLVRPAVEAGEKLGFLPGDLAQKVDPYLRPLYDALYDMLGLETVGKLIERGVIEIAPLAYMRGRTLNSSFVILDESQNTTREQMKMFLTRIGFGSTAVITGDPSQIDLARGQASGLRHALDVLEDVDGISRILFTSKDVVRHPIVQRIVEAYERAEAKKD